MGNPLDPKVQVGILVILVILAILILTVSYLAVGSFNPLTVYASASILAKIIVSLLAILFVSSLMGLLGCYLIRKSIEITTGKRAEDVICPGCTFPLIKFIGSHGRPVYCRKCGEWWHDGPACYNKGMPKPSIAIPTYFCPHCRRRAASNDRDLFNEEDFMRFTEDVLRR